MTLKNRQAIKILFAGGGTAGSVTPLLAVAETLKKIGSADFHFLWLGSKKGPEREMAEEMNINFQSIAGGKWRRYFSFRNFFDVIFIFFGFFQSLFFILKYRPALVMSAGSFIAVPVVWAAWFWRTPVIIHQQDVRPGLANKLMAPGARVITVSWEKSLKDFGRKAVWIGNPTKIQTKAAKEENLKLEKNLPLILLVGGSSGAAALNKLAEKILPGLVSFSQVILISGQNKRIDFSSPRFHHFDFLSWARLAAFLEKADLVISRAGMNLLTELSFLAKPAILIPMPGSHQEDNTRIFAEKKAAVVLSENSLTAENLEKEIKRVLTDEKFKKELSLNISKIMKKGANEKMAEIIEKILKLKNHESLPD